MPSMTVSDDLRDLGVALAIGLLVGIERGWEQRLRPEGSRVAGVRTFGLAGLVGGTAALLALRFDSPWVLAGGFVGFALLLAAGYLVSAKAPTALGMTTEVAALLTFALGALAVAGHAPAAVAATVAVLVLLRGKRRLHHWVEKIEEKELGAAVTLLLLVAVALPLLPDAPVDPWGAVAPRAVLWMVILVAGVSFVGYVASRALGERSGLLATAGLGALVSSTAVTLSFSRLAKTSDAPPRVLAAGVVAACAVMPVRVLVVSAVVNPEVAGRLAAPVAGLALGAAVACAALLRRGAAGTTGHRVPFDNPLDLGTALRLAAVLTVVLLLAGVLRDRAGDAGIYALSAASGVVDVDAITLSLSRMAGGHLSTATATTGIAVAMASNTAVKAGIALVVGGGAMGRLVALGLAASLALGVAGLLV